MVASGDVIDVVEVPPDPMSLQSVVFTVLVSIGAALGSETGAGPGLGHAVSDGATDKAVRLGEDSSDKAAGR